MEASTPPLPSLPPLPPSMSPPSEAPKISLTLINDGSFFERFKQMQELEAREKERLANVELECKRKKEEEDRQEKVPSLFLAVCNFVFYLLLIISVFWVLGETESI